MARFARTPTEVREAQRLRHAVFAGEMGARLHTQTPGLDHDELDEHCHHLLVWDQAIDQVVGCTRILTDQQARQAGGYYSQGEFDINRILAIPGRFMELGRTCVHVDYRNGATITALWTGLADFIAEHDFDHLIGCASIPLGKDYSQAHAIFADLAPRFLTAEHLRARPLHPLPVQHSRVPGNYVLPPLLKAYLRVGARICGEPCLDPDFQVADLFILLSTRNVERRYARHFMGRA
ncbi:MAG: GNAT family N-acetyltransferase [Candidatus Competibacteraceae bacterium]|nr:GNAT family N-acetyltransferase [Candidatus Competibacteraceae bacterium]